MATQFLKKFKVNSSNRSRVQDFELLHPINKTIKPSQIYLDNEVAVNSRGSQYRTSSQDNRKISSIVLQPIQRPKKHTSSCAEEQEERSEYKVKYSEEDKKSLNRDSFMEKRDRNVSFRIRSPRSIFN